MDRDSARHTTEHRGERGALICSHCGRVAARLQSADFAATIPGTTPIHQGDLICEDCIRNLNEQFTDEQSFTRPPS
jgi:hypothetical protein